jgi:hypothetical protein
MKMIEFYCARCKRVRLRTVRRDSDAPNCCGQRSRSVRDISETYPLDIDTDSGSATYSTA